MPAKSHTHLEDVPEEEEDSRFFDDESAGPFTSTSRPAAYFLQEFSMRDGGAQFPVQEVVPNTNVAVGSSHNLNHNTDSFLRNRFQRRAGSTSNVSIDALADGAGGQPPLPPTSSSVFEDALETDNLPIMVKPKALYQNPLTPTVLPSTYHPINTYSAIKATYLKEFFAEILGTMVMLFFGGSVVTQVHLGQQMQIDRYQAAVREVIAAGGDLNENTLKMIDSLKYLISSTSSGTFDNIAMGWAGAGMLGWFAAGGSAISGAHLNPAITISSFVFRGFPGKKVPIYILGQYIGAFCGTLISYSFYRVCIGQAYADHTTLEAVGNFFYVVPQPYLTRQKQFVSELVCTGILQLCAFALTDSYTSLTNNIFPLAAFFMSFVINASLSYQTGCAMNPARDMGPRLALYACGFKKNIIWQAHRHFVWVPQVAPIVGALTGGLLYDLLIYQGHESPVNWPLSMHKKVWRRTINSFLRKTPEKWNLRGVKHRELKRRRSSVDLESFVMTETPDHDQNKRASSTNSSRDSTYSGSSNASSAIVMKAPSKFVPGAATSS
ncbi:MIP/aquaporin family protein KNAG_0E01000 [Huiozyma naganishii CBS 8797]|uniref:Aquaporin n=1 Tax=Huiozyma naganishii (strain ATCC MYA-139 / BCRC 22969 / CBS 8797 / KCTC 17520 / NBRC 10181 / NCYC 3082 / Yp74L-3) TaxID=1071383 RepID=J7RLG2_HUIN7|nr:hypothetical protein KNAG_0E01000 [Kazachstania naganishii CBS 8797]CCK70368.1 hypothetical protein KNAG_0E01000 [Kazachstania naganishii CBS 8797]